VPLVHQLLTTQIPTPPPSSHHITLLTTIFIPNPFQALNEIISQAVLRYPPSPRVNKSPLLPAMATGVSFHQPPTGGGHLLQFRLGEGEFWDSNYCLFIRHLCLQVVLFLKANCLVHNISECRTVSLYAQITRRHCLIFRRTHKTVAINFDMSVCPSVRAKKAITFDMSVCPSVRAKKKCTSTLCVFMKFYVRDF